MIVTKAAILADLDRKTYTNTPAIIQTIAVRVPDWNIAQVHANPVIRKKIRCLLILLVMAKMKYATAVEAIQIPKFAASLCVEKYRISVPPLRICVVRPALYNHVDSAGVNPMCICFQVQ